jgi:hypothetical protein
MKVGETATLAAPLPGAMSVGADGGESVLNVHTGEYSLVPLAFFAFTLHQYVLLFRSGPIVLPGVGDCATVESLTRRSVKRES